MLEQEKIGRYIAEKRKKTGLTQKELAERVGLTDKAVSKWERGKSIPDHDVILRLCEVLGISVNEFLSGEDIFSEDYTDKAEENMISLMKDKQSSRYEFYIMCITGICGIAFILLGIYSMSQGVYGNAAISRFVDVPSLLFVVGVTIITLCAAGMMMDFIHSFMILFSDVKMKAAQKRDENNEPEVMSDNEGVKKAVEDNMSYMMCHNAIAVKKAAEDNISYMMCHNAVAVKFAIIMNILAGVIHFVSGLVMLLSDYSSVPEGKLPAVVSIELLSVWYGLILALFLVPIYFRMKKHGGEDRRGTRKYREEE